jgi:hypothetical protein
LVGDVGEAVAAEEEVAPDELQAQRLIQVTDTAALALEHLLHARQVLSVEGTGSIELLTGDQLGGHALLVRRRRLNVWALEIYGLATEHFLKVLYHG